MTKSEVILAAMAGAHEAAVFDPVRIQKLIFLIEEEAAEFINGPHFDFKPYRYGPFDKSVFRELERLNVQGKVRVLWGTNRHNFALTARGRECGKQALDSLSEPLSDYFQKCARWVLSLSFGTLLSAIYEKYPHMAANSVASDVLVRYPRQSHRSPVPDLISGAARTFDLAGVFDEFHTGEDFQSDLEKLREDWAVVGDDLRRAMAEF